MLIVKGILFCQFIFLVFGMDVKNEEKKKEIKAPLALEHSPPSAPLLELLEDEYDTEKVVVPDVAPRERRAIPFEVASGDWIVNGTNAYGSGKAICETNLPICHSNATCVSLDALNYLCCCKEGFTGDGKSCQDVDECQQSPCSSNATCLNTQGNYTCSCNAGFEGNGFRCSDINECQNSFCSNNATCLNTQGNYTCSCNVGFEGSGFQCSDVDECLTYPCSKNASCSNTEGTYICSCNQGYKGGGFQCSDVDECQKSPCSMNATCFNTKGNYTCSCNTGFEGNGFQCTDTDECAMGIDSCSEYAVCNNTVGSYTCTCNANFLGDGNTCTGKKHSTRDELDVGRGHQKRMNPLVGKNHMSLN